MRNLPCLGVGVGSSGGGSGGIGVSSLSGVGVGDSDGIGGGVGVPNTGKTAAVVAAAAAAASLDATTVIEAPCLKPHTTPSYFATTYYHLSDDECMFKYSYSRNIILYTICK
ncbi:unnamed protein product [Ceratitis capitata]|uniref:(Mediterranean fruit fly) hypothetical protein n=1 Tax=Ceratitis capitata TaxID=7213 RepID=A0A811UTR1_CERCA|nr:unnamed protein product [Ceratitis capitata]